MLAEQSVLFLSYVVTAVYFDSGQRGASHIAGVKAPDHMVPMHTVLLARSLSPLQFLRVTPVC